MVSLKLSNDYFWEWGKEGYYWAKEHMGIDNVLALLLSFITCIYVYVIYSFICSNYFIII